MQNGKAARGRAPSPSKQVLFIAEYLIELN